MFKLTPNANKVFQGEIFSVWQWEQKMYDGSTATFEAQKRPNSADTLSIVGDKILICKQTQPDNEEFFYSLPGGRCDEGENPLESAQRELLEETGYTSDNWIHWKTFPFKGRVEAQTDTFVAKNCLKTNDPKLDIGEKIEVLKVTLDDLVELSLEDNFRGFEFRYELLKLKLDTTKYEEFRKLLFG